VVELARGGDSAAFGVLVQRYQEAAFHLAYVIVGEASEAEDVAQDAFLKAYVALPRFRTEAPFRPWLLQIVANEARNRRRSAGRRAHLTMRVAADEVSSTRTAPSPESIALAKEQRNALLAAVDALRDEDRLAIAGRYFLDLSEGEIADMLGCARGTVKSRVSRGLARLRERLNAREAIAILVGAALLGLGLIAWPDARNAIADRLGLRGVSITHVDELPSPLPTPLSTPAPVAPGPTPQPVPVGASLGLGTPVALDQAAERFGAQVLLPATLGPPDAVYVLNGQVSLAYAARQSLPAVAQAGGVGLLLTEFRASVDTNMMAGKGVPSGTNLQEVQVNGGRGFWIEGAPHLFFREANGNVRDSPARLAGNTLLWEQGGLTLRIESGLQRDPAMGIAEQVRGTD
jgi:RNA polymerase sigma factor (sigma-70 family)